MSKVRYIERPCEFKASGGDGRFTGYGSVFGEVDSYRDIVMKGAFAESLQQDFAAKERKVPMLWQHDTWSPIGIYTNIKEDEKGLYLEGECNMDVQQGRECFSLMKQGALTGLSIGYNTIDSDWDEKTLTRKLLKVKLWEVSPVTFPAGDSARAQVKQLMEAGTLSELEDFMRDAWGVSRTEAKAVASRFKAVTATPRDAVDEVDAATLQRVKSILDSINKG